MAAAVHAAGMGVVAVERGILAVHLLRDDDTLTLERSQGSDHPVIVVDAF